MAYIKEALDRYPDTTILTTDEIETPGTEGDLILGSDISNMELEQTILDTMGAYSPSIEEAFFTAFNPLFSLAFIIGTEGLKLSVSAKDKERAILSFKHRATRTVTSQSVGALVYALGGGWLALPATIMTGVVYEHLAELYETSLVIDNSRHLLILLQLEQQGRNMPGYR